MEQAAQGTSTVYQIRIQGLLGEQWADWFGGLAITPLGEDTLLTGHIPDQAALHGLLKKLRDLGIPLLSLNPLASAPAESTTTDRPSLALDVSASIADGKVADTFVETEYPERNIP